LLLLIIVTVDAIDAGSNIRFVFLFHPKSRKKSVQPDKIPKMACVAFAYLVLINKL
jgi:hypothetical protein